MHDLTLCLVSQDFRIMLFIGVMNFNEMWSEPVTSQAMEHNQTHFRQRNQIILPDGGLVLRSRAYAENAALLLAIDHPEAVGQFYTIDKERTLYGSGWRDC